MAALTVGLAAEPMAALTAGSAVLIEELTVVIQAAVMVVLITEQKVVLIQMLIRLEKQTAKLKLKWMAK